MNIKIFPFVLKNMRKIKKLRKILSSASDPVPTQSGFPLILSGFGAYSIDLRYFGSLNDDFWNTNALDFKGKLRPSLSSTLSTTMQIDLFHASTDVKVKSNVYSNYAFEIDAKSKDKTYASLKMIIPQDRNDILSIRSQLIANIEGKETLLNGISERYKNSSCTWPSIDDMLGLRICVDYSLPDVSNHEKSYPSLVLSGPLVFDVHLDKSDLSAKLFNFDYRWNKEKDFSLGSITFETPLSAIPREFSAILKSDPENYNLTMGFRNGASTQTALGCFKNSLNEKSMDFSVNVNGKEHFSTKFSWKKTVLSKSRSKLVPLFLLTINDQKIAGMVGQIRILDKNNISQV
jgi:Domain of unknown function (DUF1943)/Domain of Unknown Function (DUF1081)